MANLILRDFRLLRDFRSVNWPQTVVYNLMRATAAGIILGILMFCMATQKNGDRIWAFLAMPLLLPLGYFFIYLPIGFLLAAIGSVIPFIGLVSVFIALIFVSIGDPVVCVLKSFAPRLVPVERPPFFSLALIYWVLKAEETARVIISH